MDYYFKIVQLLPAKIFICHQFGSLITSRDSAYSVADCVKYCPCSDRIIGLVSSCGYEYDVVYHHNSAFQVCGLLSSVFMFFRHLSLSSLL